MNIKNLRPEPADRIRFSYVIGPFVPSAPGCYALATFAHEVLYVGLASVSIRSRFFHHLDDPHKTASRSIGMPFWCFYLRLDTLRVNQVERAWLHEAILLDGCWPPLNRVDSPLT